MRSARLVPWILGLATSVLLCASFPKADQGWMSLFALVPWLLLIYSGRRLRLKIGVTAVAFLIFFGFSLAWIRFATWLGFVPVVMYLAAYPVVFCLVIAGLGSRRIVSSQTARLRLPVLAVPVVWTALEWLRGNVPTVGFPWLLLGHTLHRTNIAQAADIIGCYGLSFIVAAVNSAVAFLVLSSLGENLPQPPFAKGGENESPPEPPFAKGGENENPPLEGENESPPLEKGDLGGFAGDPPTVSAPFLWQRLYLAVCLVLVVFCWVYGALRLREESGGAVLRVGVVQANADKDIRRDSSQAPSLLDLHLGLSRKLGRCDIIVWSETSVPVPIEKSPYMMKKLSSLAKEKGTYLLMGGHGREGDDRCNSAFFISSSGEFIGRYDKIHLVPFGEYIPLPRLLSPVVRGRVPYKRPFRAGTESAVFNAAGVPFSVLICWEDIFPDLVGRSVRNGARLLVDMTSEGWFSTGAELEQHLAIARMSAIAFRIPIVRVTNTGISAWIDPYGRITRSPNLVVGKAGVDVFAVRVP